MKLQELFSTEKRVEILKYVLYCEDVSVVKVVNEIKVSKGLVSKFLKKLSENKLLVKRRRGKYTLSDNAMVRSVKMLLNIACIDVGQLKKSFIKGFGLYGSWGEGTNTIHSDVDVWIKVDEYPDELELAEISKKIRGMTKSEVQLTVLTPKKIKQLEEDEPFYKSLLNTSICLWGEPIERNR